MKTSKSPLSNLQQRVLAGSAGALLLGFAIFFSPYTFGLVFLCISMLTQWELYKLLGLDGNVPMKVWGLLIGATCFVVTFCVMEGWLGYEAFFGLFPLFSMLFVLKLYRKDKKPLTDVSLTVTGVVYIALAFSLLVVAAYKAGPAYAPWMIMGILLLLWASDVGAYFAGKAFGKRKLFERHSPKKTWEGFAGGAATSLMVAFFLPYCTDTLSLLHWLGLSALITVTGSYGDLVESQFKRSIMIKDSGSLIPGHGGFLDRFDGLLLAAPFVVAYLHFVV